MKKLFLLLLLGALIGTTTAQKPIALDKSEIEKCRWVPYPLPVDDPPGILKEYNPAVQSPLREITDYQVGSTVYDKQSNYMVSNRIQYYHEDNTIGLAWMKGDLPNDFDDRGTGYNFFDGSSWLSDPSARIEGEKTGWPTYAPWGAEGELVVAHLPHGLVMSKRPQRGVGSWTTSTICQEPADPTWARIITSGTNHDTLHILASSFDAYMGQDKALLYFRSPDGGDTWDIPGIVLDGTGSDFYTFVQQDSYAWAEAKGNTLAFVCCSAWHDMFIMKSTDGGDNWEKTVVWEHPYPYFDFEVTLTDTFFCVDNSASIAIDNAGMVHVSFGINRVVHNETGTGYWLFYLVDGIGYWNEDMETFSDDLDALCPPQYEYPNTELVEDYNYIGWTQDVDGDGEITLYNFDDVYYYNTIGLSTMPCISVDDEGRVFIIFASTTETYHNFQHNYKHIWARAFGEESGWTEFVHVSSDIVHMFDECVYPILATNSTDYLHLIYQADATPGTGVDEEHIYQENRMTYARVNKYEFFPWDIKDNQEKAAPLVVSQNYPNPATDVAFVNVTISVSDELKLEMRNMAGQTVLSMNKGLVYAGNHLFTINIKELSAGIYFYTVNTGNQSVTRKMIIH